MPMSTEAQETEPSPAGGKDNNNETKDKATKKGNNNNSTRLSKTSACLPIVYGSIAFYLGKKADEFQTHEWTLFVRGPHHEDLSPAIAKVVFQLHPSFAQPVRELTHPPFEVTEQGWGEFEAQIRIVWTDPSEKPTVVSEKEILLSSSLLLAVGGNCVILRPSTNRALLSKLIRQINEYCA